MPSGKAVFTSCEASRSCAFSFARHGRITVNSATSAVASRIRPAANPAILRRSGKRRIGASSIGRHGGFWQVFGLTCSAVFVNLRRPMAKPSSHRPQGPGPLRSGRRGAEQAARAQYLLGLFAYHRDAPLVARSLAVSLEALNEELDALGIRRKAYRVARGTDAQMPLAAAIAGPSGPPVRRRPRSVPAAPPPPAAEAPPASSEEAMLRALLAEVGPRRTALGERLGTSGGALLARFRAAGLERELSLRERDLIRALWSKHRGSERKVAAELRTTPEALREIAIGRGLVRELEAERDRLRREALRRRWPRERIEQVLHRRDELRELGILEGLDREVAVRAGVIWNSLRGKRDASELFAKKLQLTRGDALRLSCSFFEIGRAHV